MLFRTFIFVFCFILVTFEGASAQGIFDKVKNVLGNKNISGAISGKSKGISGLTQGEVGTGLREALRIGTEQVVSQLGKSGGFNDDKNIHIPLPGAMGKVQSVLGRLGLSSMTDDLELRLNRAAEQATPKAKALFFNAISDMSIEDAHGILTGPKDSATSYLREKMGPALALDMRPIVDGCLLYTSPSPRDQRGSRMPSSA